MVRITLTQTAALKEWFQPERPGPLIGPHIINTGHGACHVDRWPNPQVVLVETAGNYTLLGDPQALTPDDLRPHLEGFVEAPASFVPLFEAAFPDLRTWPRIIFAQEQASETAVAGDFTLRRLQPNDARLLDALSPQSAWISKTWGGHAGLAASGYAWGAFVDEQLASVACTFFLADTLEEIGVATEPHFQRMGLSTACAAALCRDIWSRGRRPSWTTSPDNMGSVRVAQKLGFTWQRDDVLYVVGVPIPD